MFSLRIHSLDSSALASASSPAVDVATASSLDAVGPSTAASSPTSNSNKRFQILRGIVHLFRNLAPPPAASYAAVASSSSSSSASASASASTTLPTLDSLLPPMRGKLLFVLAVANALSPDDFVWVCDSYLQHACKITFVRNDGMEDRYSVLVEFDDQIAADRFYLELNGWRFPSSDVVRFLFDLDFGRTLVEKNVQCAM